MKPDLFNDERLSCVISPDLKNSARLESLFGKIRLRIDDDLAAIPVGPRDTADHHHVIPRRRHDALPGFRNLYVPYFEGHLLAELFARHARECPHRLNGATLPADQLADIGRRYGHFDESHAPMLSLGYLDALRRVGQRFGDGLDHVANAGGHDAAGAL